MFLLSACANQVDVDSSVASTMEAVTLAPSILPLSTSLPTRTPRPSLTPRPTFTITNTPEPSPTIPPATVIAQATLDSLALEFPELEGYLWIGSVSSNGKWASIANFSVLRLLEINGDKQWNITYFDHHNIYICRPDCGDHVGIVGIDHWSWDNTHVYLIPYPEWDGPDLWFTTGGSTLIRFNLIDGSWTDLNVGGSWSFSSNEGYLVYFVQEKSEILLRSLLYDSEYAIRVPEKFESLGRFVWSPDNTQFAFTATYGEWYDGKIGFSAYVFDTRNLSLRTLFEDDLRFLYTVAWTENEKITLNQFNEENVYFYDLTTNQIISAP